MQQPVRSVERVIARIASRQYGVVTRRQLLDAGITPEQIRIRLARGSLIHQHRGVYRVGHRAPSIEATYLAAVLACGDGALLCGRTAAHHLGLLKRGPSRPEVIAPREHRLRGIASRRWRRLEPDEAMVWRGIPVTSVARTVVDISAALSADDLARACHEAGVRFGMTPRCVDEVLDRRPSAPGAGRLRRVLHGDVPVALSALERAFRALLLAEGLPPALTNKAAGGRRIDCRWPEHRLTVELDGYRYHASRHAWERDRRREREARARGDEFRRYTYGDVLEDRRLMLAELRQLLPARS